MTASFKHFLLACFTLLCSILNPQDSTKENALGGCVIQNGRLFGPGDPTFELKRGQYPFMVMLQVTGLPKELICTGSIVSPKGVITSSACIDPGGHIVLWAGNNRYIYKKDLEPPTQRREVAYVRTYPEHYAGTTLGYIITKEKFDYTDYVKPVGLILDRTWLDPRWRSYCYVLGFGVASPVQDDSRVARYMVQYVWSQEGCIEFLQVPAFMCSPHDSWEKTICGGDIGGPVLCPVTPGTPGEMKQFGVIAGRLPVDSRMMDLDCVVPQRENRHFFVGYFHNLLREIPDLPKDGPSYPPINNTDGRTANRCHGTIEPPRKPTESTYYGPDETTRKPKGNVSGARRLKVSVQMVYATIMSSILATGKIT